MNNFNFYIVVLTLTFFSLPNLNAQVSYPTVGSRCPDFYFNEVVNGDRKTLSLDDLKGEYVILDFWSRWCTSCIASFPHLNKIQQQFNDRLKIILVGKDDEFIRPLFQKLNKRYNLQLSCAFDEPIFKRFGIRSVPHQIWLDRNGIIKAIVSGESISTDILEKFIAGKSLNLPVKSNLDQLEEWASYNLNKPFLMDGNGGADSSFIFRSVLTKWNRQLPILLHDGVFTPVKNNRNSVFVSGAPLLWLYKIAYNKDSLPTTPQFNKPSSYGKLWYEPILELADTSLFQYTYETGKNIFCYNLTVNGAKLSWEKMQQNMQRDLQNYFGYQVTVETRKMPYWKLIKIKGYENLKTKGGKYRVSSRADGITLVNNPSEVLVNMLWSTHQSGPPFVDETGLTWNIDIAIDAVVTDLEDLRTELRKKGLDLVKALKDTQVIVIRTSENNL